MSTELILADAVRDWAERTLPGDDGAAQAAVAVALGSYAGGASLSEACQEARRMLRCRTRHPSRPAGRVRTSASMAEAC